jgi:anti-sigma factor RsiW
MKNPHVSEQLGAYLDGELSPGGARRLAAHLDQCPACRAELAQLRALSRVLREEPPTVAPPAPDRFAAQVTLRLARRPRRSLRRRTLRLGWRLAPLGLLSAWAFVQATLIVAGAVSLVATVAPAAWTTALPRRPFWLQELLTTPRAGLREGGRIVARVVGQGGPLGWGVTLPWLALMGLGLLYLSWLASWWTLHRRRAHRRESGFKHTINHCE